jgi:hypothetical protein
LDTRALRSFVPCPPFHPIYNKSIFFFSKTLLLLLVSWHWHQSTGFPVTQGETQGPTFNLLHVDVHSLVKELPFLQHIFGTFLQHMFFALLLKIRWIQKYGLISGPFILFYQSMCIFLCQDHEVSVTKLAVYNYLIKVIKVYSK